MLEAGGKVVEYFDPNNIESISSSIVKVLESKPCKKTINSGYDQVKHFSWQLCSKQTFEIYKSFYKDKVFMKNISKKQSVCIIGLGFVGLTLSVVMAQAVQSSWNRKRKIYIR